jgi:HAMP domain-containing protein
MMIVTRLCGCTGGLLVVFYAVLTLRMPEGLYFHFCVSALVVTAESATATVFIALWELRHVRRVLRRIDRGEALDPDESRRAGREAVTFPARHHRLEAWFVPCSTLMPVLVYLAVWHGASPVVMINITLAVFMGIAMAVMAHFFAIEHCMEPVVRQLLLHGVPIDFQAVPKGSLRFRLGLCSLLIVTTTALMIGTIARQRASDLIDDPVRSHQVEAVKQLKTHSAYITFVAVLAGVAFMSVMAGSVTKRVNVLVSAMERVGRGRPIGTTRRRIVADSKTTDREQQATRDRARRSRGREPCEERIPRKHLARTTDSAERRDRHDRPVAGNAAQFAAAKICPDDEILGQNAAGTAERSSRFLEN